MFVLKKEKREASCKQLIRCGHMPSSRVRYSKTRQSQNVHKISNESLNKLLETTLLHSGMTLIFLCDFFWHDFLMAQPLTLIFPQEDSTQVSTSQVTDGLSQCSYCNTVW